MKQIEISVQYYKGQNYTPADAMRRWANDNYAEFYRATYGEAYIHIYRGDYYYESWRITENEDDTETVTLVLKQK